MKEKVNIRDKSFDGAGLKKDYKDTIIEYILNGFEAGATVVSIFAEPYSQELTALQKLEVIDNGHGISFETREETFGSFLISQKEKNIFFDRVNKGKGRYTFSNICSKVQWTTVYEKEGKHYKYTITISNTERDYCDYTEPEETIENTGTTVTFLGITKLTIDSIENEDLEHSIITFFAKYLYLHKEKHIYINGKEISYKLLIDDSLSSSLEHEIRGVNFEITFIKWLDGSNRKSYVYYVDENYVEKYREHTKCNNNAVKFYHSIFVESPYFNTFLDLGSENSLEAPNTTNDIIFKEIRAFIFDFAKTKLKQYVQNEVPGIIQSYIDEGLFPEFADDPVSLAQKEDLTSVLTSVYCIQPNIFYRTKKDSKKAIIGCLNLILKTDERDNIITILDSIQKLTPEERDQLADTLRKYEPSSVVRLLNTVKSRYEIIDRLKTLIYDNTKFTNERDHIQKIIEQNYWLFGEEYNLVAADERLDTVLNKYLNYLDKYNTTGVAYTDPQYRARRPDIFISSMRDVVTPDGNQQENIIVELKAPHVQLTFDVYRQIEDYMRAVKKDPEFNSVYVNWKFISVCTELSQDIIEKINSRKDKGKKGLADQESNYEIYAYTWADVFTMFDIRHRHLYGKLQKVHSSLYYGDAGREKANALTKDIMEMSFQAK